VSWTIAKAILTLGTTMVLVPACGDECPAVSRSCDDGCHPMRAFPLDPAKQCVTDTSEIVGCTSDETGTDDAPCVKRLEDGAMFIATQGSPFRNSSGWAECTDAEEAALMTATCSD
jgi:hypothetical protein